MFVDLVSDDDAEVDIHITTNSSSNLNKLNYTPRISSNFGNNDSYYNDDDDDDDDNNNCDDNDEESNNEDSNDGYSKNSEDRNTISNIQSNKRPIYKLSKEEEKEMKRKEKELNKVEKEVKLNREKINKKKLKDVEDQEKERNDQYEFGLYRENLSLFSNSTSSNEFSQCGLIQWTFRKSTQGGKCSIGSINSEIMPIVAIFIPSQSFIDLAQSSIDEYNTFPKFDMWIEQVKLSLCKIHSGKIHKTSSNIATNYTGDATRVVVVLIDIETGVNLWQKAEKKKRSSNDYAIKQIDVAIDNAIAYLMIDLHVETVQFKTKENACEYLHSMTSCLARSVYTEPYTDLDCITKNKFKGLDKNIKYSEEEKKLHELRETWISMIRIVPGVSEDKARNLARHYSCPVKLMKAFQDKSIPEKTRKLLLQDKFDEPDAVKPKKYSILSTKLFNIMTSTDPEMIIE